MNITDRLTSLNRIRRLSRLMDSAFKLPIVGLRVGWDPIIGLIPGAGDLVATAVSVYIIFLAARFQLPSSILSRMAFNVLLETVIGAIPLLGDIFDAFYKSNMRNLELLEEHLQKQIPDRLANEPTRIEGAMAHSGET